MFSVNFWAVILTFFLAVFSGEGNGGAIYVHNNPSVIKYLATAAITSALGQNFVFFTISNFNSLTLMTITTTRKLFTFILSVHLFGHRVFPLQWIGMGMVFSGLVYELVCFPSVLYISPCIYVCITT